MRLVRAWLGAALVMVGLQSVQGCSESYGSNTPRVELGNSCDSDAWCPGATCIDGICSKHCKADTDCLSTYGRLVCGVDSSGLRSCVPPCDSFRSGFVCVDGVSTSCEIAPQAEYCEDCGCPGAQRCEPGKGCEPKRAAGEPCKRDDDCNTDNCSNFAGVCRAPLGAPCDKKNCDVCLAAEGWSYCSRECVSESECGSGLCLGYASTYYCRPPCSSFNDSSCPGNECALFIDDRTSRQAYYCDCADEGTCSWMAEARPLGQKCRFPSDCVSELCDSVITASDPFSGRSMAGLCTQPCTTSAECGQGFACAAVDSPHCLPTCTDSCAIGECVGLPTAEGPSANLCWVKRSSGSCWEPSDCQSGNCVAGSCAPAGGQANGAACDTPENCQSKSCIAGQCRGNAVLGEACTSPADCAVGMCCSSGELMNTCATDCQ